MGVIPNITTESSRGHILLWKTGLERMGIISTDLVQHAKRCNTAPVLEVALHKSVAQSGDSIYDSIEQCQMSITG